ncbi:MAG: ABC transporter permease, partial [Terriglobus roseus]|nr:ABC transporter permease [Terriglobus roseus]
RFMQVMGVEPVAGRVFSASDAKGTDAVVSASFAREHFDTVAAAINQPVRVEGHLFTIVGVLPDGFGFPDGSKVWVEADAQPEILNRTAYNQQAVAKRRVDVTPAQLSAELEIFSKHLQQSYADDRNKALIAVPLQQSIVGDVAPTLHLLMGSVALVLLIVCANITHLQLVRATRQIRETAVRSALGASRARLAARAVAEAISLSVLGCAGAILLAFPALTLLVHLAPSGLPRLHEVTLSWRVVLVSLAVSSVLMAATALVPVWRSWHVDQTLALRQDSSRGMEGRSGARLRSIFLVAQIAFALVLGTTAVLLARQLVAQSREDLGFDREHLYTLDSSLIQAAATPTETPDTPEAKQEMAEQRSRMNTASLAHLQNALNTLRETPGVVAAEAMQGAPLGFGGPDVGYAIRGRSVFAPGVTLPVAEMKAITPGALEALRVPLLGGRAFNSADHAGTMPVVLVSKKLADTIFPGEDPVGKQIMCGYDDLGGWWTIVGVTGSLKSLPGSEPEQTMYVPVAQHAGRAGAMQILVRTAPNAPLSEELLRQRLTRRDANIAATATSMAQNLAEVERDLRFRGMLFESFAAVSVLLAMLGIYGATAYAVTQRTFEFGLRIALGASRGQVVFSVLRHALWIALTGVVVGLALYAGLLRISASLIGKLAGDPVAVMLTVCGTLLLSLIAAALPARRAST